MPLSWVAILRKEFLFVSIENKVIFYSRPANTKSDSHRARINEAERFSSAATGKAFSPPCAYRPVAQRGEIACIQ
jgi:hypothetical protein